MDNSICVKPFSKLYFVNTHSDNNVGKLFISHVLLQKYEFQNKFANFQKYTTDFLLFTDPLTIQLENVTEDLQLELIVLQCNFNLKSQLETTEVPEILKYIGNRNIVITFYLCLIALISPNNKINFPHE